MRGNHFCYLIRLIRNMRHLQQATLPMRLNGTCICNPTIPPYLGQSKGLGIAKTPSVTMWALPENPYLKENFCFFFFFFFFFIFLPSPKKKTFGALIPLIKKKNFPQGKIKKKNHPLHKNDSKSALGKSYHLYHSMIQATRIFLI